MEEYRLERHLKLWEVNNKMIARVVFLTVVLSLSLIVKVLSPFVIESAQKRPHVETIDRLEVGKKVIDQKIVLIKQMEEELKGVGLVISEKPWEAEKRKLIANYREMNSYSSSRNYSPDDYQKEGNQTISTIGEMLRGQIIQPLVAITDKAESSSLGLSRLSDVVGELDNFDKQWKRQYIDVNWYETINSKNETMRVLTRDIGERFDQISGVVSAGLENLKQARVKVDGELVELNNQIQQEKGALESIEKALEEILPKWLHGLVAIHQVIQLLPQALLCVALYVMFTGSALTRHFQIYAEGKAFSATLKSEPAMSTVWTLVPRGRYGTVLTVAAYVLFFMFAWALFEKALSLLLEWIAIDPFQAWIAVESPWLAFLWLGRLVFLGLIGYVVALSWRRQLVNQV